MSLTWTMWTRQQRSDLHVSIVRLHLLTSRRPLVLRLFIQCACCSQRPITCTKGLSCILRSRSCIFHTNKRHASCLTSTEQVISDAPFGPAFDHEIVTHPHLAFFLSTVAYIQPPIPPPFFDWIPGHVAQWAGACAWWCKAEGRSVI
jgi:hypothetical protein